MGDLVIPDEMVPNCEQCRRHFEENAMHLVGACSSVAIEHGRSARYECALYMQAIHRQHEAQQS